MIAHSYGLEDKYMYLTVEEALNLKIFEQARILTGIEQLTKEKFNWISIIEGPVEDFVKEKELVLTRGIEYTENPEMLIDFIKEIHASGAAALGIAVGRYIYKIPQSVIEFAQENNFILIELPIEIRFDDIQKKIMTLINEKQNDISIRAERIQKRLINLVIQGKNLRDLIKYIENELGWKIVFLDRESRLGELNTADKKLVTLWENEYNNRKEKTTEDNNQLKLVSYQNYTIFKKDVSMETGQIGESSFIIQLNKNEELTPGIFQIIESLSAAAALWISREDAILKTELRLRNDFIWKLANTPDIVIDNHIKSRAKLFGYKLNIPYICLVGFPENFDDLAKNRYDSDFFGFKNSIYYIEEEVQHAAAFLKKAVVFTYSNNELIIFLEDDDDTSSVNIFLDLVEKKLNTLMPGTIISWGIGKDSDGILQFHESYKKAVSALEIGRKQNGPGERVHYKATELNRLLMIMEKDEEIKKIIKKVLMPLISYDNQKEMNLIDTYLVYDTHNKNVSQSARSLNLHRQSLLYRLSKIESLTGLCLDNANDALLLNISIKLYLHAF